MILRRPAPALVTAALCVWGTAASAHEAVAFQPYAPPPMATGSLPRLTDTEMQSQRTARLLAASQYRRPVAAVTRPLPVSSIVEVPVRTSAPQALVSPVATPAGPVRVIPLDSTPRPSPVSYDGPTYAFSGAMSGVIPAMPDAIPGECFALIRTPEKYRHFEQHYELRAASERIETIAPRYETYEEQFVAQEAYERLEVVPATFRMVTERVETAAPTTRYVSTEPVYETVTERILESPARSVWKKGTGPIQRVDHTTGEIMCLVEEPAVYRNVTRRVLRTPAQVSEVTQPGTYSLVSRRVIDQPATVRRVVVPERIGTRTVRRQVDMGSVQRIPVPAQVGVAQVRELAEPSRLEWRAVLCETNMTSENIRRVQLALAREGFDPGATDGVLGAQTLNALNRFQRARRLPVDEHLNLATVRALGAL